MVAIRPVGINDVPHTDTPATSQAMPGRITNCGRCGGSHVEDELDWQEFQRPIVGIVQLGGVKGDGTFTHWAMCPNNDEPILFWRGKRADG